MKKKLIYNNLILIEKEINNIKNILYYIGVPTREHREEQFRKCTKSLDEISCLLDSSVKEFDCTPKPKSLDNIPLYEKSGQKYYYKDIIGWHSLDVNPPILYPMFYDGVVGDEIHDFPEWIQKFKRK